MKEEEMRKKVRESYARIVTRQASCCGSATPNEASKKMGYTDEELRSAPESANMGLGCGNPIALASLKKGETVVDLGSGGGLDCFLAAKKVSEKGRVIGVDMTPEMIDKARHDAQKGKYKNVEFRLGEIENLPIADGIADVVISNCVINLAPNKKRVFEEAFRVLKSGGRLMVSDEVLIKELPEAIKKRFTPGNCVQGAMMKDEYIKTIERAGFQNVEIVKSTQGSFEEIANDPNAEIMVFNSKKNAAELKSISELDENQKMILREITTTVMSVQIAAIKP